MDTLHARRHSPVRMDALDEPQHAEVVVEQEEEEAEEAGAHEELEPLMLEKAGECRALLPSLSRSLFCSALVLHLPSAVKGPIFLRVEGGLGTLFAHNLLASPAPAGGSGSPGRRCCWPPAALHAAASDALSLTGRSDAGVAPAAGHEETVDWAMTAALFLFPAIGGLLFGWVGGWVGGERESKLGHQRHALGRDCVVLCGLRPPFFRPAAPPCTRQHCSPPRSLLKIGYIAPAAGTA